MSHPSKIYLGRNRAITSVAALAALWLLLVPAAACQAGQTSSTPATMPTLQGPSLSKDIQPIFNSSCVVCHQGAGQAGLALEPANAYANLVNVKSTESPLMRVAPGAPDQSYLINKLQGTQAQAGGKGAQMPFNGTPLTAAQISLIQQWIQAGAPNN